MTNVQELAKYDTDSNYANDVGKIAQVQGSSEHFHFIKTTINWLNRVSMSDIHVTTTAESILFMLQIPCQSVETSVSTSSFRASYGIGCRKGDNWRAISTECLCLSLYTYSCSQLSSQILTVASLLVQEGWDMGWTLRTLSVYVSAAVRGKRRKSVS